MTHSKRKRDSTRTKPNKRSRYIDSDASEPLNENDNLWAAECILDEHVIRRVRKYYIKWKGIDPDTGKAWEPTWEPEENANDLLVAHWAQQKAKDLEEVHQISRAHSREQSEQRVDAQGPRRVRYSRVVDCSPESTTRSSTPSTTHNTRGGLEGLPSTTASVARPSPRIQIAQRGDSFARDEYERFSQISSLPGPGSTQDTDIDSSQLFAAHPRLHCSGVVPDSQSSVGEASFIPPTQHTEGTSQQSTDTNESHVEEDVVENSGLRELIEEAAQHVISPTRSIPETIPDTTAADSQSQQQRLEAESRGAPETLESVHISPQVDQVSGLELEDSVNIQHSEDAQVVAEVEHPRENGGELKVPQSDSLVSQIRPAQAARETTSDREAGTLSEYPPLNPASADVAKNTSTDIVDIADTRPSPNKSFTLVNNSQTSHPERSNTASDIRIAVDSVDKASRQQTFQQIGIRDSQPSLIEQPLSEGTDQSPFQSQHRFPPSHLSEKEPLIASSEQLKPTCATPVARPGQVLAEVSAPSLTFPAPLPDPPHPPIQTSPTHHQVHDDALVGSLEPEVARNHGSSPSDKPQVVPTIYTQLLQASSSVEREQNAQVLHLEEPLSTQDERAESIRSTTERESGNRANSESRHDSSQETPEQPSRSLDHDTSPVPYPPSYSLRTQDSRIPPRPCTPVPTPSLSTMAGESTGDKVRRQMQEDIARRLAERPSSHRGRHNRSSIIPSVTGHGAAATPTPLSRIRTNEPPEGTRSPSAVPDRSPIAQTPTSLRNIVYATNNAPLESSPLDKVMTSPPDARPESTVAEVPMLSEPIALVPKSPASDEMDVSDADDEDSESLFNDDLQLADQEFIVPLFMQGRQSDAYTQYISSKKDLLERFLQKPHSVSPIEEVEGILSQLRAIETHLDLIFAEVETESLHDDASSTQAEHAARFGMENSTKFRFLARLFHELRRSEPRKHIVLLIEREDETLFRIIETFSKANSINYTMFGKDRKVNRKDAQGSLLVTVMSNDASPVIYAPDLIICLNGMQDAAQIRKKNWANSPDRDVVPVIHLVIPRTVGHLERYLASNLDPTERMHTILASLAHIRPDIGRAIDDRTPRDVECASEVANWIENIMEGADWPLPSIGSVKDVIEYQTQLSQSSTDAPMPERTKRPLDEEVLDPAKRMRFIPQVQPTSASVAEKEHDVTHISDSMAGTAESDLQGRLVPVDETYREQQEAHRTEQRHFRESEIMWDKQQEKHEDLARDYRVQKGKLQTAETKVETLTRNNATLTERLTARTTEMRELDKQLQEQRASGLLSPNAQIAEITKLRKELAEAREEKDKAIKKALTAEETLEYMRGSYQDAQNAASTNGARVKELEEQVKKLSSAASGEATKRKGMHLDQNYDRQTKKIASLEAQLILFRRTLQGKEEENLRLRSVGRQGVGTRGTSATPQPKTRSRAASPTFMGGRVLNLRNS